MNKKNKKGFTIIELIVVIAIIAILAAIVLVNVTTYISKAKDARVESDMASIATGMASCGAANGGNYMGCWAGATGTTYVPGTLVTDIGNQTAVPTNQTSISANYCVSANLASTPTNLVCVDSTGVTLGASSTRQARDIHAAPPLPPAISFLDICKKSPC